MSAAVDSLHERLHVGFVDESPIRRSPLSPCIPCGKAWGIASPRCPRRGAFSGNNGAVLVLETIALDERAQQFQGGLDEANAMHNVDVYARPGRGGEQARCGRFADKLCNFIGVGSLPNDSLLNKRVLGASEARSRLAAKIGVSAAKAIPCAISSEYP